MASFLYPCHKGTEFVAVYFIGHSHLLDWKQRAQPLHMETEVSSPESKGYLYSQLGSPSISDLSTNGQFQSCNDSLDTDTSSHIDNI